MTTDKWLIVMEYIDESRDCPLISAIAKGHTHIAQQSAPFGAPDRAEAKSFTKLLFCK